MFKAKTTFSSFATDDVANARKFYSEKLGLEVDENVAGLRLHLPGGGEVFVYPKEDHQPATFTILNFEVDDIDAAVADLTNRGVKFERYGSMPQDEMGVMRGISNNQGPDIAWFKDPAGNILSVVQEGESPLFG